MLRMLLIPPLFLLFACNIQPKKKTKEQMVRRLPAFPIQLLDSKETMCTNWLEKGKTTIITFFDPTCHNCQWEIRNMLDSSEYLKEANVLLVSESNLNEIAKHIKFPKKLPQGFFVGHDIDSTFTKVYQEYSVPVIAFYGRNKSLLSVTRGTLSVSDCKKELVRIEKYLRNPQQNYDIQ